jgi:hypothetical protein
MPLPNATDDDATVVSMALASVAAYALEVRRVTGTFTKSGSPRCFARSRKARRAVSSRRCR